MTWQEAPARVSSTLQARRRRCLPHGGLGGGQHGVEGTPAEDAAACHHGVHPLGAGGCPGAGRPPAPPGRPPCPGRCCRALSRMPRNRTASLVMQRSAAMGLSLASASKASSSWAQPAGSAARAHAPPESRAAASPSPVCESGPAAPLERRGCDACRSRLEFAIDDVSPYLRGLLMLVHERANRWEATTRGRVWPATAEDGQVGFMWGRWKRACIERGPRARSLLPRPCLRS
jgi:hypothetical protein